MQMILQELPEGIRNKLPQIVGGFLFFIFLAGAIRNCCETAPSYSNMQTQTEAVSASHVVPEQTTTPRPQPREIQSHPYTPAGPKNKTTTHDIVGSWVITPKPLVEEQKPTPTPQQRVKETERNVQTQARPQFATVAEAQRAAVQIYPDLGIAGSKLNIKFVTRYKQYQVTRPDYFRDPSWPLRLAEEIAQPPQSK
ncbi:MAG: hypothetical protein NTV08_10140 [Verrucomicrobia bacterium]|nr:hypothetical protein [Verrucomicrobiota bacterium]